MYSLLAEGRDVARKLILSKYSYIFYLYKLLK